MRYVRRLASAANAMESIPRVFEQSGGRRGTRPARRLSDKILIAFHQACDQSDIEVASELLRVLEFMAMRHPNLPTGRERRMQEGLVAAHERLWHIRHAACLAFADDWIDSVWRLPN
jgi:hypothetical protein